ncbi:hypothetical protein CVT26_013751 [Gymnopilus dilepis]|uniref:Uncharacterized protein n=1 Tax=Gymnopilus dilepis TaxID=231916 RepID=A0A409YWD6_9AGAR|nr:hypothetical protein CVT26_013751 [Gymnopilus dilepis]
MLEMAIPTRRVDPWPPDRREMLNVTSTQGNSPFSPSLSVSQVRTYDNDYSRLTSRMLSTEEMRKGTGGNVSEVSRGVWERLGNNIDGSTDGRLASTQDQLDLHEAVKRDVLSSTTVEFGRT